MENMFDLSRQTQDLMSSKRAVTFSYIPECIVLKNTTFTVPAGKTAALVGPSGSGKNTIVRLLFRFYDVETDVILVDGQNFKTVTQQSLRRAIGVVPQDTVLFNNTIKYNIWYGRIDAADAEVLKHPRMLMFMKGFLTVPEGYDTYFFYIHVFSPLESEIFSYTLDQLRPPTPIAMLPGQKNVIPICFVKKSLKILH